MMCRIPNTQSARILVVGDVMLDRYWYGDVQRISPEAPVPIVRIKYSEERPGGAANVACNIVALGAQATLLSVIGDDEAGTRLTELLAAGGVRASLLKDARLNTTVKLRIIGQQQQLVRLDFEVQPPYEILRTKLKEYRTLLQQHDVVIFSDYGKGGLSHISEMISLAQLSGKIVLVDPKGTDWTRYRGANVITPNRTELSSVIGSWHDEEDLYNRAQALRKQLNLEVLLLTRSEEGMTLYQEDGMIHEAAVAREIFDVTGAGDTVIATLAVMRACGLDWRESIFWANRAAGIAVGKLGAVAVTLEELIMVQSSNLERPGILLSEAELIQWISRMRHKGARIVMTNGCFDLLHFGHIEYLEKARALGDCLVVAINDDNSVQRLKGPLRPINPLHVRMRMVSALSCVNCVVPFFEDTPERLICLVKPDVLVKASDYRPDEIAGASCVRAAGGEVKTVDFVDGYSTTDLINKIISKGGRYE